MKVAFTGSSGSGKTTLVKYVQEEFGLEHISGSAGDVHTDLQKATLKLLYPEHESFGDGHLAVIKHSAVDWKYGLHNQLMLQESRQNIINNFNQFVTDRSPIDNMTYFINQVGFHPEVNDTVCGSFFDSCYEAFTNLTHLIYVKAVQPRHIGVENNGSRIHNWWYQQAVDAQFNYWLLKFMDRHQLNQNNTKADLIGPKILVIDYWDLDARKHAITKFLNS